MRKLTHALMAGLSALSLVLVPAAPALAQAKPPVQRKQLLEYPSIHHPTVGMKGMVVSQNAIATEVGAEILRKGGNAVDENGDPIDSEWEQIKAKLEKQIERARELGPVNTKEQAEAAAHDDAIDESDDRLAVFEHQVVELVFLVEELAARGAAIGQRRIAQEGDIPARTEPTALGVVDDHHRDRGIIAPFEQRGGHRMDHIQRQRVDCAGPVEREEPGMALAADQDVRALLLGRVRSLFLRV